MSALMLSPATQVLGISWYVLLFALIVAAVALVLFLTGTWLWKGARREGRSRD